MASGFAQWGNDLYSGRKSYDIVGNRARWYIASAVILLISGVLLFKPGLNPGIEFRGGSEFVVSNVKALDEQLAIDAVLSVAPGEEPRVTTIGQNSVRVQTSSLDDTQVGDVRTGLAAAY